MQKVPLSQTFSGNEHTGTTNKKHLVIFDDNHAFRESLLQLFYLNDEIELVGAFSDCSNIANQITDLRPDVILMDIDMPGMNGIEAVLVVKEILPEIQVVMLTVSEEEDRIFQALRNGATGYLLKKAGGEEIVEAVHVVCSGGSPMTPAIARKVLHFFSGASSKAERQEGKPFTSDDPQNQALFAMLTPREQEILEALVDGLSYKMIAAKHFISSDTVKNHIQGIYRKLQVNSKGEAISFALKNRMAGQKNEYTR
jgi:DNA-binding NarL/FixJ family response regulator